MIDAQVVAMAVDGMDPMAKEAAQQQAYQRGMTVGDVLMEECLEDFQCQLYALRHRKPLLHVVEGGRA